MTVSNYKAENMRSWVAAFVLVVCLGMSCADEDNKSLVCNVDKPLTNIGWLAQKVEELSRSGSNEQWISQARHESMTVFIFGNCCPNCLSVYPVYNCEGTHVGNIGDDEFATSLLDHDEIIWTSGCKF